MNLRSTISVFTVGMGTLIASLDSSVNIAFPAITAHFEIPLPMIQWVVICYVLTFASLTLVFGKLGDMFGHARVFRFGLLWGIGAFVLCGSAPNFGWFLFFRFLQGVGTALVLSCGPALVTALHSEHLRSRAIGIYVMMFAVGSTLGPSLGGILVETWGWSSVFWFRAPIALAGYLLACRLPDDRREAPPQQFDFIGASLLTMTLSAVLLALNQTQRTVGGGIEAVAFAGLAAIGLRAFIRRERRFPNPIIDPLHFRNFDFAFFNLANCLVNLAGFTVMLLVPYFLLRNAAFPTWTGGLVLAASPLGMMVASPISGRLISRFNARRVGFAGALMLGSGLILIGLWPTAPSTVRLLSTLLLTGIGLGSFQVAYMDMVAEALPLGDRGVAGSLAMVTRTIGVVAGATILSLSFQYMERQALAAGHSASDSFLAGFHFTFIWAGVVPLLLAGIALIRFRTP